MSPFVLAQCRVTSLPASTTGSEIFRRRRESEDQRESGLIQDHTAQNHRWCPHVHHLTCRNGGFTQQQDRNTCSRRTQEVRGQRSCVGDHSPGSDVRQNPASAQTQRKMTTNKDWSGLFGPHSRSHAGPNTSQNSMCPNTAWSK